MRISLFSTLWLIILVLPTKSYSQCGQPFQVLHYTETSGFDHNTRSQSLQMFQQIGQANNFTVVNDNNGDAFNSLSNLQQYAVIIFSNTSGDNILNASQKQNFENYMKSGGGFVGIHGATDTYRHSTADGSRTGGWDFYAEMVGASIRGTNPKHTSSSFSGTIDHKLDHPSNKNLPDPWNKVEEYYYWENGFFYQGRNNEVLEVRNTGGNSYDSKRAVSWYQYLPSGGRAFASSLGHNTSDYTNASNDFRKHIRDAVLWAADNGSIPISEFNQVDNPGSWSRIPGKLYSAGDNTFPYTVGMDKLHMSNYRNGANNQHLVRDGVHLDPTRQYAVECKFKIIPSGGNTNSFCLNFQVKGDDNYSGNINCWAINVDVNGTNTGGKMFYMGFAGSDGHFANIGKRTFAWSRNNKDYLMKVQVNTRLDGSYDARWITVTVLDLADMSVKEHFEKDYSSFPYQPDYSGNSTVRVGANTHGTAWDMWDLYVYYLDEGLCNGSNGNPGNNCPNIGSTNVQIQKESCAGQDGSIRFDPSGGKAPYTFKWSNGSTSQDISGLIAGDYTVTITDADGCSGQRLFTVGKNDAAIDLGNTQITDESCGNNNGKIQLIISGGTQPYTINWADGSNQLLRENLGAGNYSVAVTDQNGCSGQKSFAIENLPGFDLSSTQVTHESCEKQDGKIQLIISGGTQPYTINWADGSNQVVRENLVAGNYSVTVSDQEGCVVSESFMIEMNQSELIFSEFDHAGSPGNWSVLTGGKSESNFQFEKTDSSIYISAGTNKYHNLVREGVFVDPMRPFVYETQFKFHQPTGNALALLFMVQESGSENHSWATTMVRSQGKFKYISFNPDDDHYGSFFVDGAHAPIQHDKWYTYRVAVNQRLDESFAQKWVTITILAPNGSVIGKEEANFGNAIYQPDLSKRTRIGVSAYDSEVSFRNMLVYYTDIEPCLNTFPIELIEFEAIAEPEFGRILLNWSTSQEENNDFFTIEKSIDGQLFTSIGTYLSQGNSTQVQHYEALDTAPSPGLNYYRLKQTDLDGSFQYFPQVEVFYEEVELEDVLLNVFPIPARINESITMTFGITPEENMYCAILNEVGQEVIRAKVEIAQGENSWQLPLGQLPAGIYFLMLTAYDNPDGNIIGGRRLMITD